MNIPFHYVVKGRFIRCLSADKLDFVSFEEQFQDKNPILARNKAFEYFANYFDILMDSGNDIRERFKLTTIPAENDKDNLVEIPGLVKESEIEESIKYIQKYFQVTSLSYREELDTKNGIGIYLVMTQPLPSDHINTEDFITEDYPIYGIDYEGDIFHPEVLFDGLTTEFEYYRQFGFDYKGDTINVKFFYTGSSEPEDAIVLRTPFNWDMLYYDEKSRRETESLPMMGDLILPDRSIFSVVNKGKLNFFVIDETKIVELLNQGEGKNIEFKSTLLFNPETGKAGISKKAFIAKTICSFLNTHGGILFIGVNDKGKPIGLDSDFNLAKNSNGKDFFKREFDEMIFHFLKKSIHEYIYGEFVSVRGKPIFVVTVYPSKHPVFITAMGEKQFYIRASASDQLLSDSEEVVEYCLSHPSFINH